MPAWKEMLILLGIVFFLAVLVRTFLFQAFYIPSGSMQNTLQVGDRVLVNKMVYHFREPRRGEVVVFSGTSAWAPEYVPDSNAGLFSRIGSGVGDLVGISRPGEKDFVKRVIGLPGDTVACCDENGRVTVNGVGLDEPYVTLNAPIADSVSDTSSCADRNFRPVVVQPGMMFVMGDHRLVSQDSRCVGQVPMTNLIGRAEYVVIPTSRLTSLSVPPTFAHVPKAEAAVLPQAVPIGDNSSGLVIVVPLMSAFGFTASSRGTWREKRRRLRA
jgi:signal peptidase I